MTKAARLQALQTTLQQRGVLDVKLHLDPGRALSRPKSEVADSVADFLQAYVDQKATPVHGIDA